jgi:hypothetical protein
MALDAPEPSRDGAAVNHPSGRPGAVASALFRRRALSVALSTALAMLAVAAPAPVALADPIVEYPVTGAGDITAMAPGSGGSMWYEQALSGLGGPGSTMTVAHVDNDGHQLSTAVLAGSVYTPRTMHMSSAADGGAWVVTDGASAPPALVHFTPDGSAHPLSWPAGLSSDHLMGMTAGGDGRLWVLACHPLSPVTCAALAVATDGGVTHVDLPATQGSGAGLVAALIATTDGVWMQGLGVADTAAFVSYAGAVTPQAWATSSLLVAGAGGDSAWLRDGAPPAVTLSVVDPSGARHDQRVLSLPAGDPPVGEQLTAAPGRGGSLLWTADSTASLMSDPDHDGSFGVLSATGDWRYDVPRGATAVLIRPVQGTTGNSDVDAVKWSGTGPFGVGFPYEAPDGGVWVISGSSPGRFSYRAPSGAFRNFRLPSQHVLAADGTFPVYGRILGGLTESSTGYLWTSGQLSGQNVLARANPLSPPAAELMYSASSATPTTAKKKPAKPVSTARLRHYLDVLARHARFQLSGLRTKRRRATLPARFPTAGTITVVVRIRRGTRHLTVATGKAKHRRPVTSKFAAANLVVRVNHAGRKALKLHGHTMAASITATYTVPGRKAVRVARAAHI